MVNNGAMKTTLDEMQAFLAVIDSGSISAAAEQLGQTPSGVSRALGRLEDKLGTTLLTRTTRRLHLTAEGEAYLRHARAIIDAVVTLARDKGVKPAQVALAWVLQKTPVTAPIVGVTKLPQLTDALGALDVALRVDDVKALEAPYRARFNAGFV